QGYDIRWQVAMITARIRKFMRKTGRSIDLKPKNGITFDKSKIECFNCQKLGHFARECRFAKYQENKANGRNEKRIVAIEDSNSKALVATDNNEKSCLIILLSYYSAACSILSVKRS
ncbi:ribonuclease H-like domain-containing protein, partial [Tanacetum coccineum]